MSEETIKSSAGQGLGIAGLIVGIIALVISFIPCLGMFALFPGVIALILSGIGVMIATKKNGAKGITIAALIISVLACGIAGYQTKVLMDATEGVRDSAAEINVKYDSCEDLIVAYSQTVDEIAAMQEGVQEKGDAIDFMGAFGGTVTLIAKVANIQTQSTEMSCAEDENYQARLQEIDNKYIEVNGAQ